jgi:cation/acetate symporter
LPIGILVAQGDKLPIPLVGTPGAWGDAMALMTAWTPAAASSNDSGLVLALAIAIGVGVLAPLLAPAIATRDRKSAHVAGRTAIVWSAVMAVLLAVSLAAAALATDAALVGKAPDRLPDYAYAASGRGLIGICGKVASSPTQASEACRAVPGFAGVLRPADIAARGAFLATALPTLRGSGEAFSGLAAAGMVSVALVLAASAFQALATALGHDAFYRLRGTGALTSRRLAVTRGILLIAVAGAGAALVGNSVNAREMIGLAITFSAASIAPLLGLAFWPRASASDATFALLCGLGAAEAVIVSHGSAPTLALLAAGALIACLAGALGGMASSLMRAPDPLRGGGVFIDRLLHAESDVLHPDKGA